MGWHRCPHQASWMASVGCSGVPTAQKGYRLSLWHRWVPTVEMGPHGMDVPLAQGGPVAQKVPHGTEGAPWHGQPNGAKGSLWWRWVPMAWMSPWCSWVPIVEMGPHGVDVPMAQGGPCGGDGSPWHRHPHGTGGSPWHGYPHDGDEVSPWRDDPIAQQVPHSTSWWHRWVPAALWCPTSTLVPVTQTKAGPCPTGPSSAGGTRCPPSGCCVHPSG